MAEALATQSIAGTGLSEQQVIPLAKSCRENAGHGADILPLQLPPIDRLGAFPKEGLFGNTIALKAVAVLVML